MDIGPHPPDVYALTVQQANMKAFANAQGWEITAEQARGLVGIFGTAAKGEIGLLLMGNRTHLTRNLKKINDNLRWLENQFVEVVCADGIIPRTSAEMLHELLKASNISTAKVH